MSKNKRQLDGIKSSLFSRGLSMAKLSVSAGTKLATHTLSKAFGGDENSEKWNEFLKGQAQTFSKELGELKGSLMKAGQLLSIYGEHFFPPEANQLLRSLYQDSPAVKWAVMEKILIKHLGPELVAELEIDPEPIGTASLGQVHKAKIKSTNQWLALKIQYPNVDKAIDSDLRAIRSFLSLIKLVPKDFNTDHIFNEIRQMLVQETNYLQEADLTEIYFDLLKNDSRFVVPKVHRKYSNNRVLATSFESGLQVEDPIVSHLAQDRRNQLALHFMELYFKEIFEWGFVQTDPHFGNYKIRVKQDGQDQIVLLDFGATRKYPDDFMVPYRRMIKAMFYDDLKAFEEEARKLKFLEENDSSELRKLFSELCFEMVEPFLDPKDPRNKEGRVANDGTYNWKETDLPQRSSQKAIKILQNFKWRTPPQEVVFLDRKAAGVFVFLSHLRARVRGRELLKKYLDVI